MYRQICFLSAALTCLGSSEELVPLRLKKIVREDRIPIAGKERHTVINFGNTTIISDPGTDWEGEKFAAEALAEFKRILEKKESVAFPEVRALSGEPEVKIVEVKKTADGWTTRVKVESQGTDFEQSAIWICSWTVESPPKLVSIRATKKEMHHYKGPRFSDVTCGVLGNSPRFQPQVMRGMEFWAQRITRIGDLAMTGHHGIAVGDVNGDGLEDVYVCDAGSLPNQLYLQQADGTAKEVAADWGVDWLEDSRGALLVDLDNDGDQDLVVATIAMIAFAENLGGERFILRGGFPGAPYPFSLSAADFDRDGDLDLYTCVYSAGDESLSGRRGFEANSPIPFNDANNGGRNILLANLGEFRFSDVTAQVGLDAENTRWSFAAAWEDMDRDGDPDLYVANDFGRNCFYRNDNGQFTNIAAQAGVEDMAAGMSVAWGDYNCDGAADLYVGNMFSAAGSRVGGQRKFDAGLQRMARGNSLFSGKAGAFQDVSLEAGVTGGGWAWSSAFADLNNDGWEDLVVANGYLTNTRDDDL